MGSTNGGSDEAGGTAGGGDGAAHARWRCSVAVWGRCGGGVGIRWASAAWLAAAVVVGGGDITKAEAAVVRSPATGAAATRAAVAATRAVATRAAVAVTRAATTRTAKERGGGGGAGDGGDIGGGGVAAGLAGRRCLAVILDGCVGGEGGGFTLRRRAHPQPLCEQTRKG